jgi:hypothetical protein
MLGTTTQERPKLIQIQITPNKKPVEKLVGSVDTKTGEFKGKMTHKRMVYPPKQFIPFTYTAYVKKVIEKDDNGKYKEYEGKIEFLSLNESGGEYMELRFLSSGSSLDRKFQEKHGFKPLNEEDGVGRFFQGAMIYDIPVLPTNELYRTFMENHPNNGDNPNRPQGAMVYFKIRNGKSDVEARKAKMQYEKKVNDLKMAIAEDDNTTEVFSIIYNISPSYELNSRRDKILSKFDEVNGADVVLKKSEKFFTDLQNRFQFLLNKGVVEISGEKLIFKADKKVVGLKVKFGADADKYSEILAKECASDHKVLSQWISIEKQLNN